MAGKLRSLIQNLHVFQNVEFVAVVRKVRQYAYPSGILGSTLSPNMYFFDVKKTREMYPKWNQDCPWCQCWFRSHFTVRRVHVRSGLPPETFWKPFLFRAFDFRVVVYGVWTCVLHTEIRKPWLRQLQWLRLRSRGSSTVEQEFEPRSRSSESVHLIAMLSVNVLQDAEGRINSFLQCHALVALRRKARPALSLGFPGDSAMGARDQYCARSCPSPRSCWWPELCVPHHALCLSCWHANPGRAHSCMGMNRFFQLWPRL